MTLLCFCYYFLAVCVLGRVLQLLLNWLFKTHLLSYCFWVWILFLNPCCYSRLALTDVKNFYRRRWKWLWVTDPAALVRKAFQILFPFFFLCETCGSWHACRPAPWQECGECRGVSEALSAGRHVLSPRCNPGGISWVNHGMKLKTIIDLCICWPKTPGEISGGRELMMDRAEPPPRRPTHTLARYSLRAGGWFWTEGRFVSCENVWKRSERRDTLI